jgi:transposase
MEATSFATQRLDHRGMVAGICQRLQLIEQMDAQVGPSGRQVSVGEAVPAMGLNALGFASRALDLTPEFFANKPVGLLIRAGLEAADLNDDSLGRALDGLYEAGLTKRFARVAAHALTISRMQHRFVHLDSTSVSLQGAYATEAEDPQAVRGTYGYAKDHRPDLKQAVVSLICTYRATIPVWLEALSGNRADKATSPTTIQAYGAQLPTSEGPSFVADSALDSEANLRALAAVYWITRVPEPIQAAQHLLHTVEPAKMHPSAQEGYRDCEVHRQ